VSYKRYETEILQGHSFERCFPRGCLRVRGCRPRATVEVKCKIRGIFDNHQLGRLSCCRTKRHRRFHCRRWTSPDRNGPSGNRSQKRRPAGLSQCSRRQVKARALCRGILPSIVFRQDAAAISESWCLLRRLADFLAHANCQNCISRCTSVLRMIFHEGFRLLRRIKGWTGAKAPIRRKENK
jgi:hypothetical protein